MVSKEITGKVNAKITEEDRVAQRMIHYALVNEDEDELRIAFEYIYNLYYNHLRVLALSRVDILSDAEDVVLDSFNELFIAIMQRKKIDFVKGFLYKIFFRKIDRYNSKNSKFYQSFFTLSHSEEYPEVLEFIEIIEIEELLEKVLSPKERYIFVHHVFKEEPLLKIKEDLKLNNKDIFKIYNKIVIKLRKGVEDYYGT